jgi:glycosyltransferase involved in cell wall biosynthesis
MPTLSIAMCTYNGARYLGDQLNSILQQTCLPDDMVICDDGSTDATIDMLEQFVRRAPFRVQIYINPVRLGASKNFEQAVNFCGGQYIALADQDDMWRNDKLAVLSALLEKHPQIAFVFTDALLIDENSKYIGKRLWQSTGFTPQKQAQFRNGDQLSPMLRRNMVTGATMMVRSDILRVVPPMIEGVVHDFWLAFFAIISGYGGMAITQPTMSYRIHAQQSIGLGGSNLPEQAKYALEISAMSELVSFLQQQQTHPTPVLHRAIALLNARKVHFEARMHIRSQRIPDRLKLWLAELNTGRYGQFSNAWLGALKDLLWRS